MLDKQLAEFAYQQAGIPKSEWREHANLDWDGHGLSDEARACYRAIAASYGRRDGRS